MTLSPRLNSSLLQVVLPLAFATTMVVAWMSPIPTYLPISLPQHSSGLTHRNCQAGRPKSWLSATPQIDDVETSHSSPSLDRRSFFQSSATKAALFSTLLAVPISPLKSDVANAADYSTFPKVYQPPPHSMDGKLVVITGGNAGLGLESAKRLADAGATVVFTSRDESKGQKALEEINQYLRDKAAATPSVETQVGKAVMVTLDLCDLDNVKTFKDRLVNIIGKDRKIDVLMNNAGVMAIPDRRLTKDGFEKVRSVVFHRVISVSSQSDCCSSLSIYLIFLLSVTNLLLLMIPFSS